jgi:hypothetical protein
MGRYAFFNTEFEYKFAFGLQDSDDIETFGGFTVQQASDPEQIWSEHDMSFILEELHDLLDFHAINENIRDYIESEQFSKDVKGTYMLSAALYKNFKERFESEVIFYRFRLGCLIYHQLLYKKDLKAVYEL